MGIDLYREYRIKTYLNARHYIIIGDHRGEVHPHTWEFSLQIRIGRNGFTEFGTFEKGINDYLASFQNVIMNEREPFDAIIPTIENVTDYFAKDFYRIIRDIGGELLLLEASETPTRSYILDLRRNDAGAGNKETREKVLSDVMDAVLDRIVK